MSKTLPSHRNCRIKVCIDISNSESLERNYNYIACVDAFHPSPVADPEGVQGCPLAHFPASAVQYPMKMK